jgi:hypothetical protein
MPSFEEHDRAGRVARIHPSLVPACVVVSEEEYQYSWVNMALSGMSFSCWFTDENGEDVPDSDACVHMAEPSTGRFVLYEIEGVSIRLRQVKGCRFVLFEGGRVAGEGKFSYCGLRETPRRCITQTDFLTSRFAVRFKTSSEQGEQDAALSETERSSARGVLDAIMGKK